MYTNVSSFTFLYKNILINDILIWMISLKILDIIYINFYNILKNIIKDFKFNYI